MKRNFLLLIASVALLASTGIPKAFAVTDNWKSKAMESQRLDISVDEQAQAAMHFAVEQMGPDVAKWCADNVLCFHPVVRGVAGPVYSGGNRVCGLTYTTGRNIPVILLVVDDHCATNAIMTYGTFTHEFVHTVQVYLDKNDDSTCKQEFNEIEAHIIGGKYRKSLGGSDEADRQAAAMYAARCAEKQAQGTGVIN